MNNSYSRKENRNFLTTNVRKKYFRRLYDKRLVEKFVFYSNLVPGDLFISCHDKLATVSKISYDVRSYRQAGKGGPRNATFVVDMNITDTTGEAHSVSHCLYHPTSAYSIRIQGIFVKNVDGASDEGK